VFHKSVSPGKFRSFCFDAENNWGKSDISQPNDSRQLMDLECGGRVPALRDGDAALEQSQLTWFIEIQSAVAASLCQRTPKAALQTSTPNIPLLREALVWY